LKKAAFCALTRRRWRCYRFPKANGDYSDGVLILAVKLIEGLRS